MHAHMHTHRRKHARTRTCPNDLGEAWADARCERLHSDVGFWIHMDVWKD